MDNKVTDFPQYRKLKGRTIFYRINNEKAFDELQYLGSNPICYSIEANQYPEMLRIQDMLSLDDPFESMSIAEIENFERDFKKV